MTQSIPTNLGSVAVEYLRLLKVRVSATTLITSLKANPFYPSLYSLSSVCDRLNTPNQAYSIHAQDFNSLQAPFIAYFKHNNIADFVLVTEITRSSVQYSIGNKSFRVTKDLFIKNYREIVFIAEPNESSGENDYDNRIREERKSKIKKYALACTFFFAIIIFLTISMYTVTQNLEIEIWLQIVVFLGIKLLGTTATILILVHEIDKSNAIVKSICAAGKQNGCDAVLNSKFSKIFGMSWGEIGFYYFLSTAFFLLLPGVEMHAKLIWLTIGTTLASPYIIFSLYYQWWKIRQWCPLCLTVQAVIVSEMVWTIFNFWLKANQLEGFLNLQTISMVVVCGLLPIVTWNFLKPVLLKANQAPEYEAAYKRLLHNPETFLALLHQQPSAYEGWQNLGITLGNPDAQNTIIKVCNPYCGPCAKAHSDLEEIIFHKSNYNLKIIFTATNVENDSRTVVVRHLLAIAETADASKTTKAVNDWYGAKQKNYDTFAAKYPLNGELKLQDHKIEAMDEWCKATEISSTPTIFINGKRLPDTYCVEELKYIL